MKDWQELLSMAAATFGIDWLAFKAGIVGGFVSLTYERKRSPWQAGLSILTGAVLAGYLGPMAAEYLTMSETTTSGASFLIGLLAMRIIPGLFQLGGQFAKNPLDVIKKKVNGERTNNGTSDRK